MNESSNASVTRTLSDVITRQHRSGSRSSSLVRDARKVTEKVDQLTVFGGLDRVLKDVVRIQVPRTEFE
jgi:hypothetical protein